jgi:trimeric autotransporter adhesin
MRKGEGKTHYGFIAQELMEVAPHTNLNLFDKVEEFHAIRYDDLIAPSVKAIQELAQKVEALEKENAQLKSEKTDLNSRLGNLESQMKVLLRALEQTTQEQGKK